MDDPSMPPACLACEDTGYEPGMPGYYCTFCKAGCKVATAQMKAGVDPWNVDGQFDKEELDTMDLEDQVDEVMGWDRLSAGSKEK